MQNVKEKLESLEFLMKIMQDIKTPLNNVFNYSELLKFEIERKKKMMSDTFFVTQEERNSEFDKYAEYAKEISDAVFEVNKILKNLNQKNLY